MAKIKMPDRSQQNGSAGEGVATKPDDLSLSPDNQGLVLSLHRGNPRTELQLSGVHSKHFYLTDPQVYNIQNIRPR